MRSIAAGRAVAGAVALVSTAIFIKPAAADDIIYFTPSCAGRPEAVLGTQLARTITGAHHVQDDLGSIYSESRNGVEWFLQKDFTAALRLFTTEAGFTISPKAATEAKSGDLVLP